MNNVCPNCGIAGPNLNCNLHTLPYFGNMTNPCKEVVLSQPIDRVHALEREKDLFAEIGRLNVLLSKRDKEFRELSVEYQRNLDLQDKLDERDKEIERLKALMPPDERGPGFVGQGSWSVYAEKVVAERDALREILAGLREKGVIDGLNRPLPLEGHHKDCGHGKDGWSLCTCVPLKQAERERANKQLQLLVEEGQNLRKEFDKQTSGMRGPPQCSKCGDTGLVQVAPNARGVKQCDCKKYGPHHPECGRAKPGMRSPCNCLGLYERDARNQRNLDRIFDDLMEDDEETCEHGNTVCKRCGVGQPTRDPRQDLKVGDIVRFEVEGVIIARQSAGIVKDYDGNDYEPIQYVIREPVSGNNSYIPYNKIINVIGKEEE